MDDKVRNSDRELQFTQISPKRDSRVITRHGADFVSATSFEHKKRSKENQMNRMIVSVGLAIIVAMTITHGLAEIAPDSIFGQIQDKIKATQDVNIEPRTGFKLPDEGKGMGGK